MEKEDDGSRRRTSGAKGELIRKVETGWRCKEGWVKVCSYYRVRIGVIEMGRKSEWSFEMAILGTGLMLASFHCCATVDVASDMLNRKATFVRYNSFVCLYRILLNICSACALFSSLYFPLNSLLIGIGSRG